MYWLVFGLLIMGVIYEIYIDTRAGRIGEKTIVIGHHKLSGPVICFTMMTIVMTGMAALRWGQGTDWFGYRKLFSMTNLSYHALTSIEPVYRLIAYSFNIMGIPYEVFVALLALFEMFCIWRFIQKYSPYKTMSLLLLYPTLYLTYIFSCYREAVALAIFLGFCIPFLQEGKWIKYCAGVMLAVGFHKTALLLLVIPIIYRISYKWLCRMIIAAVGAGIVFCVLDVSALLEFLMREKASYYLNAWGDLDFSPMGMAERTLMVAFILWGSRRYRKEEKKDDCTVLLCKIYVVGYMISVGTMRYSLISSRTGVYFKAVEIVLIPILISQMKPLIRKLVVAVLLLYVCVFFIKNIAMYISQSGYLDTNIWNYPYISIFTRDSVDRDTITGWPGIDDKRNHLDGYIRYKYIRH